MFIRVKSTPNSPRKSIQIVESTRIGDKVKQKIIRYVGIAMNENEEKKLRDLALEIIAHLEQEKAKQATQLSLLDPPSENEIKQYIAKKAGRRKRKSLDQILPINQVTLDDIIEKARIIEGVHEVAGTVYDQMYQNILLGKKANTILKDLVLTRLVEPCSKYQSQKRLLNQFCINHDLDAIYRVMDKVHDEIDEIKKATFQKTRSLYQEHIDLLLFDVTTLYFESTTADELRRYGYSKDHRFNTTQLVLALATNTDGLPIGYELFEGNKAEVKTLIEAIENWNKLFNIQNVCFIGDRAMMSKHNLEMLEEKGYQYIIAAKLRALPHDIKKQVLSEENYKPVALGNEIGWVGEFSYNGRKLISSYKRNRALKDSSNRQQILNKINHRLKSTEDTKQFISNQGVKKYTRMSDSVTIIDEEKIASDEQWDGLHGVLTNIIIDQHQTVESILLRYSRLWKIEESFRINKHTLKMRPIFHWKPERIKAHIAICYMAFSTLRHLQYRVELRQKVSINTILDELCHVQSSIHMHKITGDLYRVPGVFSNTAKKIYKALDLTRSVDASIYQP